jgi:hypothetical protein
MRLKEDWRAEYTVWRTRPITERYLYIWADGIYLGVGIEVEHSCLLVVIGNKMRRSTHSRGPLRVTKINREAARGACPGRR